ncbi:hypothetical protein GCM10009604_20740 [Corynebacterium aurimucosum]|uniref:hypothetical protein n=1 Tax=Corynebacterium aurimucosum TaxID=169292 RepID=UPI00191DEDA6|nr:hypothetical protein [Corynebacterium aurimucosum]QQU95995.1 hypothetical protein I6I66_02450 [Corynebacterium aurimucosum]UTA71108.1 hypothetical protein J3S22_10225 [Corynebacterium aurimucosum]WJY69266.1 hypothetical protein CAURIM_00550 [Corynebacterium aurimucosum]
MYSSKKEHLTPAQRAAQDERAEEDKRHGHFLATEHTSLPLNGFMTRLIAEELPILDSASRGRVYEILRGYEGPEITSQEELPEEIREIMDLY